MPSSWSHIKTRLEDIFEPSMNLTLDHDFTLRRGPRKANDILWRYKLAGSWDCAFFIIPRLMEEYKNRPIADIFEPFERDVYFLTDVLRACDRRIGKKKLFYQSFLWDGTNPARKALGIRMKFK